MYRIAQGATYGLADVAAFVDLLNREGARIFVPGEPFYVARAPGRLDVMGGIADYSGSLVLELPLREAALAALQVDESRVVRITSLGAEVNHRAACFEAPLEAFERLDYTSARAFFRRDPATAWAAYAAGAFVVLARERGAGFQRGARILIDSNVPEGKGVSSSAAVEQAVMQAVAAAFRIPIEPRDMALLCQKVENTFVGVNCGIMDQFAVAQGRENGALLLDCGSLEYRVVPVLLGDCALVILNTCHQRQLTDSKYNERRAECDQAAALLGPDIVRRGLAHATWDNVLSRVADPVLRRRSRHVVTEQARVEETARVLAAGDMAAFGRLLTASHASLRDDYEVTGPHLDAVVTAALAAPGCLGARMTGAGFGGCALALVRQDAMEQFTRTVCSSYRTATGLEPGFSMTHPADGVHEVTP